MMALLLIAAMALCFGWLTIRKLIKRREFMIRQSGRGKEMGRGKAKKTYSLEPAE